MVHLFGECKFIKAVCLFFLGGGEEGGGLLSLKVLIFLSNQCKKYRTHTKNIGEIGNIEVVGGL